MSVSYRERAGVVLCVSGKDRNALHSSGGVIGVHDVTNVHVRRDDEGL